MSQEKILSKVLIPATGETYTIGVRGSREQIALKLTADSLISWHEYEVTIQNLSDGTEQIKQLSTNGECNFEIPLGNRYSITLPYIEGYTQPNALIYTATIASRNIEYSYNNLNEYLTIRIAVRSTLEEHTAAMFNGLEVICKGSNGRDYNGTIQNGQVTILIPYGITYTIEMPQFDGLAHNHIGESYTAGITARNLVYNYIDYNNLSVYGLDAEGNAYTVAELQKMGVEKASQLIEAGAYNNATLAQAPRKDGGFGCGFCWSIANPVFDQYKWAVEQKDFGENNENVASAIEGGVLSEACGYYNNLDLAYAVKDGAGESALVKHIGQVLADAGELSQENPTPAFKKAEDMKLIINGVERSGFIPSFGQLYDLYKNKVDMDAFYEALGKTAPTIHLNIWFTSCQSNKTQVVALYNAAFTPVPKNYGVYVLCCFDL